MIALASMSWYLSPWFAEGLVYLDNPFASRPPLRAPFRLREGVPLAE